MLDAPTCEDFAEQLGSSFTIAGPDAIDTPLTLIEASPIRFGGGERQAFTLVFHSATARVMPQSLYPLDHATMGRLEIFLVPLRAVAGGVEYAATFN